MGCKARSFIMSNPGRSFRRADPTGTSRIRGIFQRIPAVSGRDSNGTCRKNTRKSEAVFRPEFTVPGTGAIPQIPATGKKRNPAVSTRIITGSSSYPIGNGRKQQSNALEIIGNYNLFQLDFNRIYLWISRGFQ